MHAAFLRDGRCAARAMKRSPGVSAAVVLTLSLGLGASTAIFSAVYGMLFRPLPYRDASRLVVVAMERVLEGTHRPVRAFFPLADRADFQASARAFESIAFYSTEALSLSHAGFTEKVDAAWVSDSLFATIGGRIRAGRGLEAGGRDRASVVISDRLRQRLFGTETALGRPLSVGDRSYEIVGVVHPAFQFPTQNTDVWLLAVESKCCAYMAIGRLKPDVSPLQAEADVNAALAALAAKNPPVYAGAHLSVAPLRDELVGDVRAALWLLLASVGLLVGVTCANATNLLFARNAARSRETAVRMALGASRGRLCAQSLAEALLVVAGAATLGVPIAAGLLDALVSLGSRGLPRLDAEAVRIDLPVFIFTLAIAAATAAAIGLLPAIGTKNLADALKAGATGSTADPARRRLQNGLVVLQLAMSVMLLVGASLLGRSLVRLMTTDIGVRTDGVATAAINLAHRRTLTDPGQTALVNAIVERVRSLPDVQVAGAGASLPPRASTIRLTLKRSGDTVDYQATAVPATPGYFTALGMKLLRGRLFSETDIATERQVMIMTADTARRFFGTGDPIGRTMSLPVLRDGKAGTAEMTLVGVVGNVKYSGLEATPDDAVFRPLDQQPWPLLFLVARTGGDTGALASVLRREIAAVDPAIAVSSVSTLDSIVATEAAQPRFRSTVLTVMAMLTLAIASVGLYGVVAHAVSLRTREFGVRMAMGADRADLLALVFLEGAKLAGAGLVVGLAGSAATTRMMAALLYGIDPTDKMSFALACGVLLAVAAAATYLPARQAARLSPSAALRTD